MSNDSKPLIYTRIETYELFTKLYEFIAPLVKRRYHGYKNSLKCVLKFKINFINAPDKIGPKRKPESKGESLLMLMKLKLDALLGYFSDQFRISAAHSGRVYNCWLMTCAKLLHLIFSPSKEALLATAPKRFRK